MLWNASFGNRHNILQKWLFLKNQLHTVLPTKRPYKEMGRHFCLRNYGYKMNKSIGIYYKSGI